jgi:hypothetical protein
MLNNDSENILFGLPLNVERYKKVLFVSTIRDGVLHG